MKFISIVKVITFWSRLNSEYVLILIKNRKPCLCVRLLPMLIKSDEYFRMKRFTSKYHDKALESRGNEVNEHLSPKIFTFYDQLPVQSFGENKHSHLKELLR